MFGTIFFNTYVVRETLDIMCNVKYITQLLVLEYSPTKVDNIIKHTLY